MCSSCSTENVGEAKFCRKCGNKLETTLPENSNVIINGFDEIIVALLSKIGKLNNKEGQEVDSVRSYLFFYDVPKRVESKETTEIYEKIIQQEEFNLENIDDLCKKLSIFSIDKYQKVLIIRAFMQLALVDYIYDELQENIILKVVNSLDLDLAAYESVKNEWVVK